MLAWHVSFLGWRRLPADLSKFEIAHFFTLKPVDIRAVQKADGIRRTGDQTEYEREN